MVMSSRGGEVAGIFSSWLIGSILAIIRSVPLAGRFLTPKIQKSKLFEKKLLGIRFFPRQTSFFLDLLRDSGAETNDEILSERNHQVYQQ